MFYFLVLLLNRIYFYENDEYLFNTNALKTNKVIQNTQINQGEITLKLY